MGALFAHTVRMLVRQRDVLIWVILFPLALATLFHVMLSNIDESYRVDPASCVVVADDNFNSERAVFFREMLDEVSAPGAGQLLDVAKVATLEEGREAVLSGDAAACITVDEEGLPSMQVSPLAASLTTGSIDQSVVRAVLDQYRQIYAEMKQTFLSQPSAQGMQAPPERRRACGVCPFGRHERSSFGIHVRRRENPAGRRASRAGEQHGALLLRAYGICGAHVHHCFD
ncbi:ABC transporter permease [Slackia isoflavoniconvertens]|uniref:ABC transporter permease n=1 Tax=Slackia isoflavoniconvertens TaxID=572010 RepID=UPI003A96AB60